MLISRLRVREKIRLPIWIMGLFVLFVIGQSLYELRSMIEYGHVEKARAQVESALSIARANHALFQDGVVTEEEAQTRARDAIRAMEFNGGARVFAFDTEGVRVISNHLYAEGTSAWSAVQTRSMISNALDGGGITYYNGERTLNGIDTGPVPKAAWSQHFEPWGWVIACAVYLDDVTHAVRNNLIRVSIFLGVCGLFVLLLSNAITRNITKPLASLTRNMTQLANNETNVEITGGGRRDEIGEMAKAMEILTSHELQRQKLQSRIVHSAKLAALGYAVSDNESGRVLECDETYATMHGLTIEDFASLEVGKFFGLLVHEGDRQKALEIQEKVQRGETVVSELRHIVPSGEVRTLRKIFRPIEPTDAEPNRHEVVGQDVTETRQLQDQLYQSQKLDAIGQLTGGVAHDFNNLLAVILSNLELLNDGVTDSDQKELIQNAIQSTLRGADLTRNMLSFARKAPFSPRMMDINQIVRDLEKWTSRMLPSTITVETDLSDALLTTNLDPSLLESGLLNLILNARDAMPQGGKLTIMTSNITVEEELGNSGCNDVEPGQYVLLSVADTGEGISPEHLKSIFEPFFTTKSVGSGSGLGLSMLDGFVRQSGGAIRVSTEADMGTTFDLYFPATSGGPENVSAPSDRLSNGVREKRATILVVEDNADVLNLTRNTLVKSGYRVIEALSGDEALKIFDKNSDIDLVLTDIVMPGELQGTTLALTLRELRPDMPIVFMSGNANEDIASDETGRVRDVRLTKPVLRAELLDALNRALSKSD